LLFCQAEFGRTACDIIAFLAEARSEHQTRILQGGISGRHGYRRGAS
jgi:hypothetical protein